MLLYNHMLPDTMIQKTVILSKELDEILYELAHKLRTNQSKIIREALTEHFKRLKVKARI